MSSRRRLLSSRRSLLSSALMVSRLQSIDTLSGRACLSIHAWILPLNSRSHADSVLRSGYFCSPLQQYGYPSAEHQDIGSLPHHLTADQVPPRARSLRAPPTLWPELIYHTSPSIPTINILRPESSRGVAGQSRQRLQEFDQERKRLIDYQEKMAMQREGWRRVLELEQERRDTAFRKPCCVDPWRAQEAERSFAGAEEALHAHDREINNCFNRWKATEYETEQCFANISVSKGD